MVDQELIRRIAARIRPHLCEIDAEFQRENEHFITLMSGQSDAVGRILKCHLVIEHYLDRNLMAQYGFQDLGCLELSYWQKAMMLPDTADKTSFVKPGIIELNTIRNQMVHRLDAQVTINDLNEINSVLEIARPNVEFADFAERIEAFSAVACVLLIPDMTRTNQIFREAFSSNAQDEEPETQ